MAKIKIVKGVYGYCGVNMDGHTTKPKTPKDAPFELNDKRAAELVADGIAVYVTEDGEMLIDDETGGAVVGMVPEYSVDMKAQELRDIAKAYMGLTFAAGTTKAEMVEQMDAYIEAHSVDGDDLPELDLDEVVQ